MNSGQHIEIPISKSKLIVIIIGSLVFVGLGVLFVMDPERYTSPIMRNPTIIFISGLASIIFFGFCTPFFFKQLRDKSPGLKISDQGIYDNSSGVSAGQILWKDIEDIHVIKIHRQRMIILQVNNPQDYIEKQTSKFKRKMMTINMKMYGSPLFLTSNGLKVSFDELYTTLIDKLKASRQ
jgi:hypothetical protein